MFQEKAMFEELEAAMSNIHKLEEEKNRILKEADETRTKLEEQIKQVEQTLDEERKNLVADVSRGKAEVLKLMQVLSTDLLWCFLFLSNCLFCFMINLNAWKSNETDILWTELGDIRNWDIQSYMRIVIKRRHNPTSAFVLY